MSRLGFDELTNNEWLLTNGTGAYACGTQAGLNTRKYHGLLVASLSPPSRRLVMLSRLEETVSVRGRCDSLGVAEYPGTINPRGYEHLRGFTALPYPRWAYQADGWTLEKSVRLLEGENTVVVSYTLLTAGEPVRLDIRPMLALRPMHELTYQWNGRLDAAEYGGAVEADVRTWSQLRVPATSRTPECFIAHDGAFEPKPDWYLATIYRREVERGYRGLEDLWTPGIVSYTLEPGQTVHLICSADPIDAERCREHALLQAGGAAKTKTTAVPADDDLSRLLAASRSFVVGSRSGSPCVIAGYPWSNPSGRDALIAFTGLLLVPGRYAEAKALLESFAGQLRNGLMPSDFPEDGSSPLYLGADVSLWFVNAVYDYLRYTGDDAFVQSRLLDIVLTITRTYQNGAGLGIECGNDGLLASRAAGTATTWMNAKISDWLVTPRAGAPVELNALWHNALKIAATLCERYEQTDVAWQLDKLARTVHASFNARFWDEAGSCCHDVITSVAADPSLRPNQLLAASLAFPVLAAERVGMMLDRVREGLLTPMGLRSLAPNDPNYQRRYAGDVVSRDRAYHQGSVYPWLLGHYVSATLKRSRQSDSNRLAACTLVKPLLERLSRTGLIAELFDGDSPHKPGGAITSARSVGELTRVWFEEILNQSPTLKAVARPQQPSPLPPVSPEQGAAVE